MLAKGKGDGQEKRSDEEGGEREGYVRVSDCKADFARQVR